MSIKIRKILLGLVGKELTAADYIRSGWTQGSYARDRQGEKVAPVNSKAVTWCALGAALAAHPDVGYLQNSARIKAVLEKRGVELKVIEWNDRPERTKKEVISVLEEAGV